MRRQPTIVQYDLDELEEINRNNNNNENQGRLRRGVRGTGIAKVEVKENEVRFGDDRVDVMVTNSGKLKRKNYAGGMKMGEMIEDGPGKKMTLKKPLEVSRIEQYNSTAKSLEFERY